MIGQVYFIRMETLAHDTLFANGLKAMSRVGLKIIFLLLCFCPISEAELELSPKTVYELLVYETTKLKSQLAETNSLVEGIEKKIEQIGSNVSLIANKVDRFVEERSKYLTNGNVKTITDASDAMFQSDVEMQSVVFRKMLINEKTHLRNTLKKFENKIKEFESVIENRITLTNITLESTIDHFNNSFFDQKVTMSDSLISFERKIKNIVNKTDIIIKKMNEDFESKLNDSEAKVSQRISSVGAILQSQVRSIASKQEEQQGTLSGLINAINTRIAAEEDGKVSFSATTSYGGTQILYADKRRPPAARRVYFDHTIFNHGGGYNTSNGIFTAPKSGTYLFIFGVEPDHPGFYLMHNELAMAHQTAKLNNKAVIGITYVNTGENVWVQNDVTDARYIYVKNGSFVGILFI